MAHQGHVERVEGVGAPRSANQENLPYEISSEVPWRHSRTRRPSCVKTNRMDLSRKQGKRSGSLKCDYVIIQWMIRWAVMMVSRYIMHGRQRWENELRAEKGQSMQSTSRHVRGESLVQADPRAEGAQR